MTEEELTKIIDDVVKTTINSSMIFGFYDLDELRQEARLECLLALSKYDGKRPLPNFLRIHVKNRYCTLRRDKFHRAGDADEHPKKLLMMPIDLESVDSDNESNMWHIFEMLEIDYDEIWERIDEELDLELRHDYLRLRNGEDISRTRRLKIMEAIKAILWKTETSQENSVQKT